MTPIAGNQDAFPSPFDIPDDSDPPAAATFNVAYEALADRTAALASGYRNELNDLIADLKAIDTTTLSTGARRVCSGFGVYQLDKSSSFGEDLPLVVAPTVGGGRWFAISAQAKLAYIRTFNANGTWIAPPNLTYVEIECVGGGGGAGAGANTTAPTDDAPGGGAGGASKRNLQIVIPTGLTSYAVTVGTGGAGATGIGSGADGVTSSVGTLITSKGGQGGAGTVSNAGSVIAPGGRAASGGLGSPSAVSGTTPLMPFASEADGGNAANGTVAGQHGGQSSASFFGGAGGAHGTTASSQKGGSGGGGGGAGPGGVGGAGGAGGNGNSSGAGVAGSNGSNAAANTGAGGGGGGGAGAGSSGSALQGNGGNGGSGYVIIRGRL